MVNSISQEEVTFKSNSFLDDPMEKEKDVLRYEMTIEYEIRFNPKTRRDEYYIKSGGINTSIIVRRAK